MKNLSQIKTFAIIFAATCLMLTFQNCAKYAIKDVDTAGVNGLNTEQLPDNTNTPVNQLPPSPGPNPAPAPMPPAPGPQVPGPVPMPPAPGPQVPGPVPMPPAPGPQVPGPAPMPPAPGPQMPPGAGPVNPPVIPPVMPPVILPPDQECVEWALDKDKKEYLMSPMASRHDDDEDDNDDDDDDKNKVDDDDSDKVVEEVLGVSCSKKDGPKITRPAPIAPKCYGAEEDDDDNENIAAACASIKSSRGNTAARAANLSHLRGKFIISPETIGTSSVKEIEDFRGKVIICNMNIQKLTNTRGKLVIYNSQVGDWSNHRGKAVLINSKVDECHDHRGRLVVIGGKAVCNQVTDFKGMISIMRRGH